MKKRKHSNSEYIDLGSIINILIYFILVGISIFWNFFTEIFPEITIQMLFAILIGTLIASEINITSTLSKIQKSLSVFHDNELVYQSDLNTALVSALKGRRHIGKLRIFALSTTIINPIVRASLECQIAECDLLVRTLNDEEYNNFFGQHVFAMMKMWDDMVADGKIKQIKKSFFDDLPSEYNIIVDDDVLIIGNYVFTDVDRSHVTIDKVFTVNNKRSEGKKIIESYVSRFDQSFDYCHMRNGDIIRKSDNATA